MDFTYIFMPWVKKHHTCEEFLKERGIKHKLIPIDSPKQNGKVERSHRTDAEEFYNQRGFRKPAGGERSRLVSWLSTITGDPSLSPVLDDATGEVVAFPGVPGCHPVFNKCYLCWKTSHV